jgi:hypothetical protein
VGHHPQVPVRVTLVGLHPLLSLLSAETRITPTLHNPPFARSIQYMYYIRFISHSQVSYPHRTYTRRKPRTKQKRCFVFSEVEHDLDQKIPAAIFLDHRDDGMELPPLIMIDVGDDDGRYE